MLTAIQTKIQDGQRVCISNKPTYSQDGTKRERVFTKHTDGRHYGDCSSAARLITLRADPSLTGIGGNTVGQYQSKMLVDVDAGIVNGVPTKIENLQVGDFLLFAGDDASRAYADFVGHVEQIAKIEGNMVTLFGFGSTPPRFIEMVKYCKTRQATKADTKKGNRGLLKVRRYPKVIGGSAVTTPPPETTAPNVLGDHLPLRHGMAGDDVKELQRGLKALGFFPGSIGGNYLEITTNAVRAFQRKHGLVVDGVFGALSFAALKSALLPIAPAPSKTATVTVMTTGNVYVRTGPGTNFPDKGVKKKGTALTAVVENGQPVMQNGFRQIWNNGVKMWISAKYAEVV